MVRLWEYADDIQAGRWPELAPLLTMLVDRPDASVLARERELILQEPDRQKRADLLACAVTIGARFFDKEFLWRFFREEVQMMREATFIEEWLEEQLQQGLQQGLQKGLLQGKKQEALALLRRVLGQRFGPLPVSLDFRLQSLTVTQLEDLMDVAVTAPDLATFQAALDGQVVMA